jgi:sterol desaturase/sphingolipid hydroxylase (fatty acid hydroxylase superfamily)
MKADKPFLASVAALCVLSVVFFLVERVVAGRTNRVQPVLRKGWFTDLIYWFATALFTKPLLRLLLVLPFGFLLLTELVSKDAIRQGAYSGFGPVSRQPIGFQILEMYLLSDFLAYWCHRLFHRASLWPFHAVHHSSEDLDWLASVRVHPVNELGNKFAQTVPLLLLGYNPMVTLSVAPVLTLYALFLHANVPWDFGPLRAVIASPVFHRWHHSKEREAWDKNFAGLFPVWDILFGTYYMPKGKQPRHFGVHEPVPAGFPGQIWHPFAVLLQRRKAARDPGQNTPRTP